MRVLYFDIDGVLLSYEDMQRPKLAGGVLQEKLKMLSFDRLVCVSGWSDLFNAGIFKQSEQEQKLAIHSLLNDLFTDEKWFIERLLLAYDTDKRCKHIDLTEDWYYMDDWADKFFSECFGEELYKKNLGNRILLVNPHGDGEDILCWLDTISK